MNALHAFASHGGRGAAAGAALGLVATLAISQSAHPQDAAWAAAAAAALEAPDGAPQARFEEAMLAYERNHWSLAFLLLSTLADGGHAESARIALQMWRHGPALYRSEFIASARQIDRWTRLWGCSGDAAGAACQREVQARQSP